jgi:cytochrome c biogenesis protein CcdA
MIDVSQSGMVIAFADEAILFLSPCVLPLLPGYISYPFRLLARTG